MCGINGLFSSSLSIAERESRVRNMNQKLSHRGPDAEGSWSGEGITLGHRRLSIIDLSDAGTQPMHSANGRFTIVYNGELYNYKELKFEFMRSAVGSSSGPYPFRSGTDTEVILAAWSRLGVKSLDYFNGMFAFALWDNLQQELYIVRDRLGIKPLYYTHIANTLAFSSEIRAVMASGVSERKLSKDALVDYLQYQTVHAPATIIEDVKMLLPGHYLRFQNNELSVTKWWSLTDKIKPNGIEDVAAIRSSVKQLFFSAVERRLVSDVPFGAFLSGGIDSSAVVGAMAEVSSNRIETFNVSFGESEFSEAEYARLVSKKFNTSHHEIKLTPAHFLKELPEALSAMDHPGGDGPNTYVVSKATRQAGITMALSGLGGDEVFCGYEIFKRSYSLEKKWWLNMVPRFMRVAGAELMAASKKSVATEKMKEILAAPIVNFEYAYPVSRKVLPDALVRGITKREQLPFNQVYKTIRLQALREKKLKLSKYSAAEIETYMQNVLLRDADQMSMAVALEVRVPFLDYKLVEFVLGVEDEFKYPSTPKKLLVESLGDLLPPEIVNRPKMGFTFPWEHWMKNDLKIFCESKLESFCNRDYINGDVVKALWSRFLKGDKQITWSRIWHMVVLENWLIENKVD